MTPGTSSTFLALLLSFVVLAPGSAGALVHIAHIDGVRGERLRSGFHDDLHVLIRRVVASACFHLRGPCTDPTSTTMTSPTGNADLIGGGIVLRVKPGKPNKSKLKLTGFASISEALTLGRGPGSPDDPTLHGGRLLVFSSVAGAFVNDYLLDFTTGSWGPKRKRGKQVGYFFKSGGPIKGVTIITGKKIVATGRGAGLGHQLSVDPHPVGVILEIGEHRYCWQSQQRIFKADKRFRSPKNPPPAACPAVPD